MRISGITIPILKRATALLLVYMGPAAFGQGGGLTIEPELLEGRYCADRPGTLTFKAKVQFTYHNTSQSTILLPVFDQIVEYSLFPDEESMTANRPEGQDRFRLARLFDATKLGQIKPGPPLIQSMAPGAVQVRTHQIVLFLLPPRRPGISVLGADHYLRVEINHLTNKTIYGSGAGLLTIILGIVDAS